MVLDNADDHNVLFDDLPQTSNGFILITSRDKLTARNLVGSYGNVILVEPMSVDDALVLLRAQIHVDQSSENEAAVLVKTLEGIPLAITQAGAYIASRTPRITVSTYLELFQESESNQEHLLKYDDAEDLRRDMSIRRPVITTWQISFNQIRHTTPAATDLLALMSMFDRQGIPEDLVNRRKNRLAFEDTVAPLMSFSLIRTEIGGQSFEMHRLIQLSIREWLNKQGQFHRWVKQGRQVMEEAFPSGNYETWTTCQMLLPHVKEVMQLKLGSDKDDLLNATGIANRCGWYLHLQGKYEEAEAMHRRALTIREKVLRADHPDTLTSVNNLGGALHGQGKYEEAEAMHRRALTGYEKVLGANHPNTLTSMWHLSYFWKEQGQDVKAVQLLQSCIQLQHQKLGPSHPHTMAASAMLNNWQVSGQ